jgi:CYTH domain-containing protein
LNKDGKVVKFRKRRTINIGIIIFLILFIYIAINTYIFLTKEHISIYEVQEGFNVKDSRVKGLILREEHLFNTQKAGYVYYFHKEGSRVAKNSSVYSIDDSTQIMDIITGSEDIMTLSGDSTKQFEYEIKKFHTLYSDYDFSYVYDFKADVESAMLDMVNQTMIEKGRQIGADTGFAFTYEVFRSDNSGVITYYKDNYETVTKDSVTKDMFDTDSYQNDSLRTTEMVSINTPIYKIVTSESWSIILPITNEQYEKLLENNKIDFTILKDDFTTTAPLSIYQNPIDLSYYAELTMDKHLSNYLEDRFLDIELHLETAHGLKVPLSAVTTKDFYLVPLSYFTTGGNSDEQGLIREEYDKDTGDVKLIFVPADIYYQDDSYGYVDTNQFPPNTWVRSTEGNRYQLSMTNKLQGVYNVNMGYAVFKRIEIIYQNEAYCVVDKNTSYGLSLYDHIALDALTAVEQKIIY